MIITPEIAQLIFLTDEGADALEFAFSAFKATNAHAPGYFMVDKDFNEVNTQNSFLKVIIFVVPVPCNEIHEEPH